MAFQAAYKMLHRIIFVSKLKKQGRHIDPLTETPPDVTSWPVDRQEAWTSREMGFFGECLRSGALNDRDSILEELSAYYGYDREDCLERCLEWEQWSVKEWTARDRTTKEGLQDFYDHVQSWSFDLMWYSYLQNQGFGFPASVLAARFALRKCPGGHHLDFGSGVGVTSQVFVRCGFKSTLADVSRPLLAFADWRLSRHNDQAEFINLTTGKLPSATYDIVTAVDTLVHVPDFDQSVRDLHRAIKPGGWLLTNFDVRDSDSVESANHLHNEPISLEFRLLKAGFLRRDTLGGVAQVYERMELSDPEYRRRVPIERLRLPFRLTAATLSRVRMPTPKRLGALGRRLRKSSISP
jgi:SAM-dependent methyltransferase